MGNSDADGWQLPGVNHSHAAVILIKSIGRYRIQTWCIPEKASFSALSDLGKEHQNSISTFYYYLIQSPMISVEIHDISDSQILEAAISPSVHNI